VNFFHMNVNKPSGVLSLAAPLSLNGSLNVMAGTFDTDSVGNYSVTVTSNVFITGGTFNANNSTMSVSRDWRATSGAFNSGYSTVTFLGASTQVVSSVGISFTNMVINKTAGQRLNVVGALNVDGNFTMSQGTFSAQGYTVTVASNVTQASGTMYWTTATAVVGGTVLRVTVSPASPNSPALFVPVQHTLSISL
jgi:uncharacterized protein with beta-barrel porin domain